MNALFVVALIGAVMSLTAAIILLVEDVLPTWLRRLRIQAAKRAARRRDVITMSQYRARRRMVGGRSL